MSSVRAVSDTEYSEGDDNSGRGLSAREDGLTTSVGDPGSADLGSGSADPGIRIRVFLQGFRSGNRDPRSAQKTVRISNTALHLIKKRDRKKRREGSWTLVNSV